jgi:hypothetical protein
MLFSGMAVAAVGRGAGLVVLGLMVWRP